MILQRDGTFLGTRLVITTTPYIVRQCPLECMEGDNKQVYKDFLHEKYTRMKKKLTGWKGLSSLTQIGR